MVLISSIFTETKSLHDRFTLTSVECTECSYYALMRFVSDSRYNWANLLKIIAKVACSIIVKLNNKDQIYTLCIDDTIIERERGKHIEGLSRTFDQGMRTKSWTPKRGDLWHIQSNKLLQH